MRTEFRFPYRPKPSDRGKPGKHTLYPLVPIQLYTSGSRCTSFEALLDSGADNVLIPKGSAELINLQMGKKIGMESASETTECYEASVGLIIGQVTGDRFDLGRVDARVPMSDTGKVPPLLGRHPFFQHFEITFQQYEPRPSYTIRLKDPTLKRF